MDKNTRPNSDGQDGQPRYDWPQPGDDKPRLAWAAWLDLVANEMEQGHPGQTGWWFVAGEIRLHADEARLHGLHDPESHDAWLRETAEEAAEWMAGATWDDLDATWEPGPELEHGGCLGHHADEQEPRCEGDRDHRWN